LIKLLAPQQNSIEKKDGFFCVFASEDRFLVPPDVNVEEAGLVVVVAVVVVLLLPEEAPEDTI